MGAECPRCGSQDIVHTVDWQDDICADCGSNIGHRDAYPLGTRARISGGRHPVKTETIVSCRVVWPDKGTPDGSGAVRLG